MWEKHILLNCFGQSCHCLVVFWNDLLKTTSGMFGDFSKRITVIHVIKNVDTNAETLVEFGQSPFWRTKPRPPLCTPRHWKLLSAGGPLPRGSWVETPPHHGSLNGNCWPSAGSGSAWPPPAAKGVEERRKEEEINANQVAWQKWHRSYPLFFYMQPWHMMIKTNCFLTLVSPTCLLKSLTGKLQATINKQNILRKSFLHFK